MSISARSFSNSTAVLQVHRKRVILTQSGGDQIHTQLQSFLVEVQTDENFELTVSSYRRWGFGAVQSSQASSSLVTSNGGGSRGTYVENFAIRYNTQALEGALLCTLEHRKAGMEAVVTVVNLLSGKSRRVECPGIIGEPWNPIAQPPILKLVGDGSFKILVRDHDRWWGQDRLQTQVYSSKSDTWDSSLHRGKALRRVNLDFQGNQVYPAGHAYLDGTLYWLEGVADEDQNVGLVRVFMEEECHFPWRLTSSDDNHDEWLRGIDPLIEFQPVDNLCLKRINISALRCGLRTVLAVVFLYHYGPGEEWSAQIKLYQVERKDWTSLQVTELSSSTTLLSTGLLKENFVFQADDDSIYVCDEHLTSYHLELNSWTDHGALPDAAFWERNCLKQCFKFDPRLNPFMVP
ncbi:hypothetical protein R1flu_023061 [Riccia fluitans]|uniref:F-box associated domain-containing protein n=1 Tax=Riccia fluitans TaxID=41844 RepID=A0ABD1XRF9_9MARC